MLSLRKISTFNNHFFKIKPSKPKILFSKNNIFIQYFLGRYIGVVFNPAKNNIIKGWHYDYKMNEWIFSKLLSVSFLNFNYELILNSKFFFFITKFLNKKKIILNKNDIVIVGPFPNTYFHFIHDFVLRLILVNNYNKNIYLPIELKKLLNKNPFNKIFDSKKIKYLSFKQNYYIKNMNYLTNVPHNKENIYFVNAVKKLHSKLDQLFPIKNKKKLYIIASRSNSTRKLLNEKDLYKKLKKYGFKLINFENYSPLEQINIARKTKIMIGFQGSNLANYLFMKKNSHLIDIYHPLINNIIYKIQTKPLKIKYHESTTIKSSQNLSGECNIEEIEKIVKRIIN